MTIEVRILSLLAGGWAFVVSLVNGYLVAWGTSAAGSPADWTEPFVAIMRTCTFALACATLLFVVAAWPPLLGIACAASVVVLIVTWIICLGRYHDVSEIVYAVVMTLFTLPGTLGLAGLWLDARADPPDDLGRPTWLE